MIRLVLVALWAIFAAVPLAALALLFELYALTRRRQWRLPELVVTIVGLPVDVACNYVVLRPVLGAWPWRGLSWKQRTVTAHVTQLAQDALDTIRAGRLPTPRDARGLAVALHLNSRDPDHCRLA